jgi:hypothetical protein
MVPVALGRGLSLAALKYEIDAYNSIFHQPSGCDWGCTWDAGDTL